METVPNPEDFTACVMHSGLEQTGSFCCSDEKVNRLWQNIDWTMRSNYFDIPTDCLREMNGSAIPEMPKSFFPLRHF